MRVRSAVGTNSGPDLLNSTHVTPADATTSTTAPNRDQTIVHHKDNVSDDVGAAPTPTSTALVDRDPIGVNAAPPLGNDIFDLENITELMSIGLIGDSIVHGCVSRAFSLLPLGQCGVVAGS
ncbi:hypothetical protein TcYC6_0001830 [Trypanosoma cruzi]|nr:hypothetical protein TcYC6_0001830 [Trypanosoma cruzi]